MGKGYPPSIYLKSCNYPPRTTRSGAEFSSPSGEPILGPRSFDAASILDMVCQTQDDDWMAAACVPDLEDVYLGVEPLPDCWVIDAASSPLPSSSAPASPHFPSTYHERRAFKKRQNRRKNQQLSAEGPSPMKGVTQKRVEEARGNSLRVDDYRFDEAPVTKPGWIGRLLNLPKLLPTLAEVLRMPKMLLINWDGRSSIPILDAAGRCIALLGGRPRDQEDKANGVNYSSSLATATGTINRVMGPLPFHQHRRGPCKERTMGVSYGGGQKRPSVLRQTPAEVPRLAELLSCPGITRIARWADFLFRTYQPKIHAACMDSLRVLATAIPGVADPFPGGFPGTCWPSVTTNAGANAAHHGVTWPHTDQGNLAWAWCAVTALGNFNPDLGGHLIFWDLGLVVRFPPGSTILLPSALLLHSNVAIQDGEERSSLVHFAAGGLFRYVDNGCKSDKDFMEQDYQAMSMEQKDDWHRGRQRRWRSALEMMTRWAERSAAPAEN